MDARKRYIHRELSWLAFNERVLEEALDRNNPLLERLRFLAIYANNLDEFYMVRVAAIRRLIDARYNSRDKYGYYPQEIYGEIEKKIQALTKTLYATYGKIAGTELKKNRIFLKKYKELSPAQKNFVKKYFESTLFPVMTPMAVDQGHPFPILPSKTIAFSLIVEKDGKKNLVILPIPTVVPRVLKLPSEGGEYHFILLDEVIRANLEAFFRGYRIVEDAIFRIIRDSELYIKEEYAEDLLQAIESEVKKRPRAKAVSLRVEKKTSSRMLSLICDEMQTSPRETRKIDSYLDLTFLFDVISQISRPDLFYKSVTYKEPKYRDIFERIRKKDFMVHLPYQPFAPVVQFIQQAAKDKNVLAIKMTLYRTSGDSAFIKSLKEAAYNNKQVTVLMEIRARFEEEKNILWARELEKAGCHVIYGIPSIKIHSKIALVVRKEEGGIRRYIHLSTGNYNERTAKVYTDFGLFTANEDFARDISDVFNVITGYSVPPSWRKIVSAPNDMRKYFFRLIDNEIENQKKYENGFISAKMNSLADEQMIEKLYEASRAGVRIRLLIRGICCLIPGVPGMSENIEVRSIVGRFLEHSRVYYFHNNGQYRVFLSSADWMTRNLDTRIELLFEIDSRNIKEHIKWLLDLHWKDNTKSRVLRPDKTYSRVKKTGRHINVQEFLIHYYS